MLPPPVNSDEGTDGLREAPRILTVGSTQAWHARIREQLHNASVETEPTGREATLRARQATPDLLIVEAVLPDMTGMAFCRSLREDPALRPLRVLMLSEQNSELDRVLAFECGADDFMAAPFSARELGARVNALLRRDLGSRPPAPPPRPERHGPLLLDTDLGRVEVGGQPVHLTPTEFRVLLLLLGGRGKVLTRRAILEGLSGDAGGRTERAVDAHVKALRRKLGEARAYIQSVRGVGYRFAVPGSG
jgi:two-component system phosphate regulon response regulator PhoB